MKPRAKAKPETEGQWTRGRPSKYKVDYCDQVIELGQKGKSLAEMSVHFEVDKATMLSWADTYPDFRNALNIAKSFAEAHWAKIAQDYLVEEHQGPKINSTLWFMNMRNRFGWHNGEQSYKHEHNHKGGIALAYGDPNSTTDDSDTEETKE